MNTFRKLVILLFIALSCGVVSAQQDTLRVRVMTYNLRFGELSSLEDLAYHIKSFKPDFVALEEVDVHTDRKRAPHQKGKDFIGELAYRTGMFGLYGKTIEYGGGYYGIGMLSKYPYIKTEKVLLPNPEKKEQRALLEALIEMGDDTLTYVTTHLEWNSESRRNMQAQFIGDRFENAPYPVIIGGEFNARHYSNAIVNIMSKSWFPATNNDFTFPAWNPIIKIDYLFARPMQGWTLVKTQTVHSQLSDHLPIVSDLIFVK